MEFKTPQSIKAEHNKLNFQLGIITNIKGKIGEAAKQMIEILHPHFLKEEEYAIPPLSLLPIIVKNEISPDMYEILDLTNKLKSEYNNLLKEHKTILSTQKKLKSAAEMENRSDVMKFTNDLILHAQTEEEILYPTSILIGEYIKLKYKV